MNFEGRFSSHTGLLGIIILMNNNCDIGSKHAIEGLMKILRIELRPWNIFVCNINPSFLRTPMVLNSYKVFQTEFEKAPEFIRKQYSPNFDDQKKLSELIAEVNLLFLF